MRYILYREISESKPRGYGQRNCNTYTQRRWKDVALSDDFNLLKNYVNPEILQHCRYKIEDRELQNEIIFGN